MLTYEEKQQLDIISAYIGEPLTEEQQEFAVDFRKNTISFSDPGTGKTHTLTAGLIMLQKYYNIPGSTINCMSFTNAATYEIKSRYDNLCKRVGVPKSVVFNTFHSLSRQIMAEAYPLIKIVGKQRLSEVLPDMKRYMSEAGYETGDMNFVKKVYYAITNMNSALMFHPDEIERQLKFQELGMSIEAFQEIRKRWFLRAISTSTVEQGDIPLYCLYALLTRQDIVPKWKSKYGIMIVDEFQDMSLLHLQILGIIANTLIVIGDMKQQIYAFNGACPQIVNEYFKLRPDAKVCTLTKSFRCKQNIADYASRVIAPNEDNPIPFIGKEEGGSVQIMHRKELDWEEIASKIKDSMSASSINATKDVMFLYRNNASAIPIIEELYKLDIPFRSSKFVRVMDIPIFEVLCKFANVAWKPNDTQFAEEALKLFPEFQGYDWSQELPAITAMKHTKKSLFDLKIRWREQSSIDILLAMQVAAKKIEEHRSAGVVLNNLLGVYEKYIIKNQWWKLDNTKEFYFNLVGPICSSKEYPTLYEDENDKMNKNIDAIKAGRGVRCYTMHSAKGLEASDVYILDCDEGIFPNAKVLREKTRTGCLYDAACDVRQERNLLYVAITRAKDNCIISYSGDTPAELVAHPEENKYLEYDEVYREEEIEFDNVTAFAELMNIEGWCKNE